MLKDHRYIILTITIAVTGCASKATEPLEAQADKNTAQPTSWHCEQDADTWSCKRRTIADIQARKLLAEASDLIGRCPQANKTRSRTD